tara:strand:- start:2849 stop:3256 length:408 start_codon:yes stop_codon:yes gene_type:complete
MTQDVLKYLQPNAAIPIDMETTSLLVNALKKALAERAMSEVQRLGQEIEQEPVAWVAEAVCDGQYIDGRPRKIWWECNKGVGTAFYTRPPQRKPLTNGEIYTAYITATNQTLRAADERLAFAFARAIEAAHGIEE